MQHTIKHFFTIGLILLAVSTVNFAQSTFGTIRGTITDSTGAVVTGATVTITEGQTKVSLTQISSDEGAFELSNVNSCFAQNKLSSE